MANMPLPSPNAFLKRLFSELEPVNGQVDHLYLDHICYRVMTNEEYFVLREELVANNELLVESQIGGRPIATFRLQQPFVFRNRQIEILELPAPKSGSAYPTGFEHVEFVTDRPLETFVPFLTDSLGIDPATIDRSGLDKISNRDLRVRLFPGVNVKFHERSLAEVIAEENSLGTKPT